MARWVLEGEGSDALAERRNGDAPRIGWEAREGEIVFGYSVGEVD